jgi:glucuronoarabinoxylan endo-1,4-beta-xylanase
MRRKKLRLSLLAAALICGLAGCADEGITSSDDSALAPSESGNDGRDKSAAKPSGTCTINLASPQQTIRGFGGSSAWHGQLPDADCDKLFNTIGLSILRVRIDPDGLWDDEIQNAKKAVARGATVFASPWSPPASMKDNNNPVGGSLLPQNYAAYANWLNSFTSTMQSNGVSLYAISVQNEPNISVDYESCEWTATQMFNFMVNNAGVINTRVMMPETFNYLKSFADPILNNTTGAANTDIVAYHWYGANQYSAYPNASSKGKDLWMTEHFSDDQTLNGAIATAIEVHNIITVNQANAYVWWWVKNPNCNIITDTQILKRGYVFGQFAKFVRPGSVRVATSGGTNISAYTSAGKAVIVAINSGTRAVTQNFTFQNGTVASVTPHVTSGTKNMNQEPVVTVNNGSFTYTLEAKSVTTFVQN